MHWLRLSYTECKSCGEQCYAHAVLQHSLLVCRWVDPDPILWSCMAEAMVLLAHLRL